MTSKSQGIWELAHAYKYSQSRRGKASGKIKGCVKLEFYWETAQTRFVYSAGEEIKYLPMPIELAETFLLRCITDHQFRERVIIHSTCPVEEWIKVGRSRLCLRHCQERYICKNERFPQLELTVELDGASAGSISLPHSLRMGFGSIMACTMPEEIHTMLHPPVAA